MRIVSLIASATEILHGLGLRDSLVGRSHECDHPPDVLDLPVLSEPKVDPALPSGQIDRQVREIVRDGLSVYRVFVDELERLQPDLIVTQDQCEVCAVSLNDIQDALCQTTMKHVEICTLHPTNLDDVVRDFQRVADAAQVPERGDRMVAHFCTQLDELEFRTTGLASQPRVALLEWLDPPMIAGGWMPELVRIAGGEPVIVTEPGQFQTVSWDDIAAADPDVIVVIPCGYGVDRTLEELTDPDLAASLRSVPAVHRRRCYVADGNAFFNRPSPRLAESAEILAGILHPDACVDYARAHRLSWVRWGDRRQSAPLGRVV